MQFHFVKLHDVEHARCAGWPRPASPRARRAATRCATSPPARTRASSADEVFDVTPYAEALTRYLPAPSARLVAAAQVQDRVRGLRRGPRAHRASTTSAGARASRRDGRRARGFRVTVGGGTSILPRVGRGCSTSSCPRREILDVAEAVLRVFHRLRRLQAQAAQPDEVPDPATSAGSAWHAASPRRRCAAIAGARAAPRCPFDPDAPPVEGAPAVAAPLPPAIRGGRARAPRPPSCAGPASRRPCGPTLPMLGRRLRALGAHERARRRSRRATRSSTVTLPLGDLTGAQMRVLADLAEAYGDGTVRTTPDQNLRLPLGAQRGRAGALRAGWRRRASGCADARHARGRHELPGRRVLPARGHAVARPRARCWATTCARARTSSAAAPGLDIKISGCPNGCGQHHVAGIGFQGSVRQLGGARAAAVLRDGGRRRLDGRRALRPPGGQDPGAARAGGGRAADRALRDRERTPARRRTRSSGASSSRG